MLLSTEILQGPSKSEALGRLVSVRFWRRLRQDVEAAAEDSVTLHSCALLPADAA